MTSAQRKSTVDSKLMLYFKVLERGCWFWGMCGFLRILVSTHLLMFVFFRLYLERVKVMFLRVLVVQCEFYKIGCGLEFLEGICW